MKTIRRTGIVVPGCVLIFLLAAGCSEEKTEQPSEDACPVVVSFKHYAPSLWLGRTELVLGGKDRFFRAALGDELAKDLNAEAVAVIELQGHAVGSGTPSGPILVNVWGVDGRFWGLGPAGAGPSIGPGDVVLNDHLAQQLGVEVGQRIVLRTDRPDRLSPDVWASSAEQSTVAMVLTVRMIVSDQQFGRFGLEANPTAPMNAFVSISALSRRIGHEGRANRILLAGKGGRIDPAKAQTALRRCWRLSDAELELRMLPKTGQIELRSVRVFLDSVVAAAAARARSDAVGILTCFVNEIRNRDRATPYSTVSAIGPLSPDSEGTVDRKNGPHITISAWLAEDLQAAVGDKLDIKYYDLSPTRRLVERSGRFIVRKIVAAEGLYADPTLMPDFPGLCDAKHCYDWSPSIPIDLGRLRHKDGQYWDHYRGTPKAFVDLAVGQGMWANRSGSLTAVRFPDLGKKDTSALAEAIWGELGPASVGLSFITARQMALGAGEYALDLGNGVTMTLVSIPAGKFMMGSKLSPEEVVRHFDVESAPSKLSVNEHPRHQVTITKPFYMGTTEVTQAQWKAVMNTQPWEGKTHAKAETDNAASYISWDDATAFCTALSKKTGRTVRLPTEAEWEYACRAGTTTRFYYGDDLDYGRLGDYAWYDENAYEKNEKYAHPVGMKEANAWGLYDMHGNVWEWCADWYDDSYTNADVRDPKGPATGDYRALRGGSWIHDPQDCRAANRNGGTPGNRGDNNGFRVVVEIEQNAAQP